MRIAVVVTKREIREVLRDFNLLFPMLALPMLIALIAGMAVLGSSRGPVNFMAEMVGGVALNQSPGEPASSVGLPGPPRPGRRDSGRPEGADDPLVLGHARCSDEHRGRGSFVGEKERNTIEPLLAAPISDWAVVPGEARHRGRARRPGHLGRHVHLRLPHRQRADEILPPVHPDGPRLDALRVRDRAR